MINDSDIYQGIVNHLNKKIIKLQKQYLKWYNYFKRKSIHKELIKLTEARNNIFKEWREEVRKNNPEQLINSGDK